MSERSDISEKRDRRAELMVRFLDSAKHIEPLEGKKIEEVFGSAESIREFLKNLNAGEFLKLLNGINGILRDKEKGEWSMDGEGVMLRGFIGEYTPPRQGDKVGLLRKAFEEAKIMNRTGRSLEDIALLLSAVVNEVHPYADANGRTSRLIYILLTKGYDEETKGEIKNVLGEYGRDVIDIDPSLMVKELDDLLIAEIGLNDVEKNPNRISNVLWRGRFDKTKFKQGIPEQLKDDFANALKHDSTYMNLTMYLYVREHPRVARYIKDFPTHSSVMLDSILPDLGEEELAKIMEIYWRLKKRHTELLIDFIAHSENPEYAVRQGEAEQAAPLLSHFKNRIRQKQQENS